MPSPLISALLLAGVAATQAKLTCTATTGTDPVLTVTGSIGEVDVDVTVAKQTRRGTLHYQVNPAGRDPQFGSGLDSATKSTVNRLTTPHTVSPQLHNVALGEMAQHEDQTDDCSRLMRRVSEYLSEAPVGFKFGDRRSWPARPIPNRKKPSSSSVDDSVSIPVQFSTTEDSEVDYQTTQALAKLRHLGASKTPGRGLLWFGDDGAGSAYGDDCLCPGWQWPAYYTQRDGQGWRWDRTVASGKCTGRCGAGCNWFDNDYMIDCFEHDVCLDHFGGSALGGNADCGDEFWDAADDYIVTYAAWCPC